MKARACRPRVPICSVRDRLWPCPPRTAMSPSRCAAIGCSLTLLLYRVLDVLFEVAVILLHRATDFLYRAAIFQIGVAHGAARDFLDLAFRFLDTAFDLILVHDISLVSHAHPV